MLWGKITNPKITILQDKETRSSLISYGLIPLMSFHK